MSPRTHPTAPAPGPHELGLRCDDCIYVSPVTRFKAGIKEHAMHAHKRHAWRHELVARYDADVVRPPAVDGIALPPDPADETRHVVVLRRGRGARVYLDGGLL